MVGVTFSMAVGVAVGVLVWVAVGITVILAFRFLAGVLFEQLEMYFSGLNDI